MNKFYTRIHLSFIAIVCVICTACRPAGYLSTVKIGEKRFANSCEQFAADIQKLIDLNSQGTSLRPSLYDNSGFGEPYLEPGQYEVREDTLFFRLVKDVDLARYLDDRTTISLHLGFEVPDKFHQNYSTLTGNISSLTLNQKNYQDWSKAYHVYKMPLLGHSLAGKEVKLYYTIAHIDKTGSTKKILCETDQVPLGPLLPACCLASAWDDVPLLFEHPGPTIKGEEEFLPYERFTGEKDLLFSSRSFNLKHEENIVAQIGQLIQEYETLSFRVASIEIRGYASLEGKESFNKKISEKRVEHVLTLLKEVYPHAWMRYTGLGEDWDQFRLAVQTSSLGKRQKELLLTIADMDIPFDEKEKRLKRLSFWNKISATILEKGRHARIKIHFEFGGDKQNSTHTYPQILELGSDELSEVAKHKTRIGPFAPNLNAEVEINKLSLLVESKPSANRFLARATYYAHTGHYNKLAQDLESARKIASTPQLDLLAKKLEAGWETVYLSPQEKETFVQQESKIPAFNALPNEKLRALAISYAQIGMTDRALSSYEQLKKEGGLHAKDLNNLGIVSLRAFQFSQAEIYFLQALKKSPRLASAMFNLASLYAYKGFTDKSFSYLKEAISLKPRYKKYLEENRVFEAIYRDPRFEKYQ